jgi:hypothetical protein
LGKVYVANADPKMATRAWQEAMNLLSTLGKKSRSNSLCVGIKSNGFRHHPQNQSSPSTNEALKAVFEIRRGSGQYFKENTKIIVIVFGIF